MFRRSRWYSGRYGVACNGTCPGGIHQPCNNRGTCDVFHGDCTCYADSSRGYWVGTQCTSCAAGYPFSTCTVACPVVNGSVCNRRGVCFNGVCLNCAPVTNDTTIMLVCGKSCELTNVDCVPPARCKIGHSRGSPIRAMELSRLRRPLVCLHPSLRPRRNKHMARARRNRKDYLRVPGNRRNQDVRIKCVASEPFSLANKHRCFGQTHIVVKIYYVCINTICTAGEPRTITDGSS